ncbi:branched-chain amino acid ABC transporter permease [Ramlibacter sp.]|uniref:branched-chain amino acid ABC transporter permease n=1 Tax=Ramlibacter sp. TaxID=1917967 RepID=UPI002FCC25FA
MSAARWRKAMNSGAGAAGFDAHSHPVGRVAPAGAPRHTGTGETRPTWERIRDAISPHHIVVLVGLLVFPFVASPFLTFQVAGQSLALGLVALSLMFLAGYGGMVSLAQMTVAGVAGYTLAILGTSSTAISLGWPWPMAILVALAAGTLASVLIGWLSVRTEGIYTIMITLAMGVAFYYLCLQNYTVFNGFQGFQKVHPPMVLGVDWRSPVPFYFLVLSLALLGYFAVKYIARAPFGVALQGIRDNPRRMNALGYNVTAHRVAAYAVAGLIASVGGVLLVWYNGLITPGSVGTSWLINVLVIAVLGGMRHPIGPFLGAIVFVLLQTFAVDVIDRERFNLVIGVAFLAIVLFSPDGLLGLWAHLRARLQGGRSVSTSLR